MASATDGDPNNAGRSAQLVAVAKRDGVILSSLFSLKARGESDVREIEQSVRRGYKGLHDVTSLLLPSGEG
jgi:hypothetical protein